MAAPAKVYVGNLSWNTTDDGLAHAFSAYGQLTDYVSNFGLVAISRPSADLNTVHLILPPNDRLS